MTSGLALITLFIESSFPLKSGISYSTIILGQIDFIALIVLAMCSAPPSCKSSLQTEVITTYLNSPHSLIAFATLSGSLTSGKAGLPLLTAQNLHALLHTSPITIIVAVPMPQHSDILGHFASSQTV